MQEFKLNIPDFKIHVGLGEANYKMSRGSFVTSDTVLEKILLRFTYEKEGLYHFESETLKLKIRHEQGEFEAFHIEFNEKANRIWIEIPAVPNETIHGCGEQFTHFNLKGQKVKIWVSEHHSLKKLLHKALRECFFGVNPGYIGNYNEHQTYYAQPTFVSSMKYFIHVDTKDYSEFDFTEQSNTKISVRGIPKSFYFGKSESFSTLSSLLSGMLGIQPKLPKWTEQGAIIAIQGGIENVYKKIDTARKYDASIVGVWCQDWSGQIKTSFGTQVYWNWQVDGVLYPELKKHIKSLKVRGIRFLGYVNTFLKKDTLLYDFARSQNFLVRNQKGGPYLIKSTTFRAAIVDLTNPHAYQWFKRLIQKNMIDIGMSGWMADFGEYLPTDACIYSGTNAEAYHNIWPELWAKLNREAIDERRKTDDVFFFTRAGYTETIKLTNSMWTGDQHVDFSDEYGLPSALTAILSLGLCGVGINHSDVGGYTTIFHMKRTPELLMRWAELSIFTPLLRYHEGNRPEANAQFDNDETVLKHFAKMTRYFNSLSPYLAATKEAYYNTGIPVNRPVFYHYDAPATQEKANMFLYGRDILVVPVLRQGETELEVELPEDEWIHLFTKVEYRNGTYKIETPIGVPCAFYRKKSLFRQIFDKL